MTDAHFHRAVYETFLACPGREVPFFGFHPWQVDAGGELDFEALSARVKAHPAAGVGEIGLDRLHNKTISMQQRTLFERQLALAAELHRPVVLHGAKCWGEVVKACQPFVGRIPAFLFHGFSRSEGLLPAICALNGFVSVGKALLNDHAVNYHALVKALPLERLLIESDEDLSNEPDVLAHLEQMGLLSRLAALRGMSCAELEAVMDETAKRFVEALA